jgi:hypothetical protein
LDNVPHYLLCVHLTRRRRNKVDLQVKVNLTTTKKIPRKMYYVLTMKLIILLKVLQITSILKQQQKNHSENKILFKINHHHKRFELVMENAKIVHS